MNRTESKEVEQVPAREPPKKVRKSKGAFG